MGMETWSGCFFSFCISRCKMSLFLDLVDGPNWRQKRVYFSDGTKAFDSTQSYEFSGSVSMKFLADEVTICKWAKRLPSFEIWCGENDLNPRPKINPS